MSFHIRKSYKFMSFIYVINIIFHKLYVTKYITSFKNITPEEYQKLINNKKEYLI